MKSRDIRHRNKIKIALFLILGMGAFDSAAESYLDISNTTIDKESFFTYELNIKEQKIKEIYSIDMLSQSKISYDSNMTILNKEDINSLEITREFNTHLSFYSAVLVDTKKITEYYSIGAKLKHEQNQIKVDIGSDNQIFTYSINIENILKEKTFTLTSSILFFDAKLKEITNKEEFRYKLKENLSISFLIETSNIYSQIFDIRLGYIF